MVSNRQAAEKQAKGPLPETPIFGSDCLGVVMEQPVVQDGRRGNFVDADSVHQNGTRGACEGQVGLPLRRQKAQALQFLGEKGP